MHLNGSSVAVCFILFVFFHSSVFGIMMLPSRNTTDDMHISTKKQTVYASTSGRRMDAAKGPRERPVYPALCWAADDYAEVRYLYK